MNIGTRKESSPVKQGRWIAILVILILAYLYSVKATKMVSASAGYDFNNSLKEDAAGTETKTLTFENERVELGIPLKVLGAPEASTYQWTFTEGDGTTTSFLSKDNTYIPTEADMETLITVTVEGLDGTMTSIYFSSLPVIYINNVEGYYGVGEEYTRAHLSMQGNNIYEDAKNLYEGDIEIRLRGNSTKWRDKRPFNIKLGKKTDLLGMGKNKKWALLANDIDHTLMRNKLIYDLSDAIGMDTYCKSENVVLIFNNEYYGVYQLCELVDVGPERVDIYDWEECAKTVAKAIVAHLLQKDELEKELADLAEENLENALSEDLSWITSPYLFSYDVNQDGIQEDYTITDYIELPAATGGALLEMDFYAFDGHNPSTMITAYSQPLYFKAPEYAKTNTELFSYIEKYVQVFEHALHSTDFIYHESKSKYRALNQSGGPKGRGYIAYNFMAPEYDGMHYSELFDLDSLVKYFLVTELSMNWDGMKNSVFMYKDIEGLFHMGPAWDYDWAWGNINMYNINTWYPTSWQTTEEDFTVEQYYQTVQWNRSLIRDPFFIVKVYEKYHEIRGTIIEELIKSGGIIDTYADEIRQAALANDARWSYSYTSYDSVGFDESLSNMKRFLELRITWMDKQFTSLEQLISSLGYYTPSPDLRVIDVVMSFDEPYAKVTAEVLNPEIKTITFQVNGTHLYQGAVVEGRSSIKVPIQDFIEDRSLNVIHILAKDSEGEYIIETMERGNYFNGKSNYYVFTTEADLFDKFSDDVSGNNELGGSRASGEKEGLKESLDNKFHDEELLPVVKLHEEQVTDRSDGDRKQDIRKDFMIVLITSIGFIMVGFGLCMVSRHLRRKKSEDGKPGKEQKSTPKDESEKKVKKDQKSASKDESENKEEKEQ